MEATLEAIRSQALTALDAVTDSDALRAWHSQHLGKKSELAQILGSMGTLAPEDRPLVGRLGNQIKKALELAHDEKAEALRQVELQAELASGAIDVTLPGRPVNRGRLHVITQTMRQMLAIWADMGFQVYRSREVETDEFNFQLLNIPEHHPAREMQDTFYTTDPGIILRTHTSPGQIHAMREYAPHPVRVVLPGLVYRYEQVTARADVQFSQIEGIAVGKNIRFSDLKGTLTDFARRLFGADVQTRFRADHFPFTEPSAEMDVTCYICGGQGCRICKYTGWVEILGCGMMHPTVLENGGYDPEKYTAYAFGMGIERTTLTRYRIQDIRYFWQNDLRLLEQF